MMRQAAGFYNTSHGNNRTIASMFPVDDVWRSPKDADGDFSIYNLAQSCASGD
jgi:hypothetical protein